MDPTDDKILKKRIIFSNKWTICYYDMYGKSKYDKFFNSLTKIEKTKLLSLYERMSEKGPVRNKEKFNNEGDGIFAIKIFKVRVYCFLANDKFIILTHGIKKKTDKLDPNDLERAKNIRDIIIKNIR